MNDKPENRIITSAKEALDIAKEQQIDFSKPSFLVLSDGSIVEEKPPNQMKCNIVDGYTNQISQTLMFPYKSDGSLNDWGHYTRLELTKYREKDTDPGTFTWALTGPGNIRKELTEEQAREARDNLFHMWATEINVPDPLPELIFGNIRFEKAAKDIAEKLCKALGRKQVDREKEL